MEFEQLIQGAIKEKIDCDITFDDPIESLGNDDYAADCPETRRRKKFKCRKKNKGRIRLKLLKMNSMWYCKRTYTWLTREIIDKTEKNCLFDANSKKVRRRNLD